MEMQQSFLAHLISPPGRLVSSPLFPSSTMPISTLGKVSLILLTVVMILDCLLNLFNPFPRSRFEKGWNYSCVLAIPILGATGIFLRNSFLMMAYLLAACISIIYVFIVTMFKVPRATELEKANKTEGRLGKADSLKTTITMFWVWIGSNIVWCVLVGVLIRYYFKTLIQILDEQAREKLPKKVPSTVKSCPSS